MTPHGAGFAAVVLAGGRSRRMGKDKATLAHPAGGTLLQRQLALLRELQPAELLVSIRQGQVLPPLPAGVRTVEDDGAAGPLGGIIAALQAISQPRLVVVAVDLPHLEAGTLRALLARSHGRGAVPRLGERLEPLAAVYVSAWLPHARAALRRGERSLQTLLQAPEAGDHFEIIDWPSADPFTNWNTPADVENR